MLGRRSMRRLIPFILGLLTIGGCGARTDLDVRERDDAGPEGGGGSGGGGAPPEPCMPDEIDPALVGIVRDFSDRHPDFEEGVLGLDLGIVEDQLGPEGLPVYAPRGA